MKVITCPRCDSQFDASAFVEGDTFECSNCGNVVVVASEVISEVRPAGSPRGRDIPARRPAARAPAAPARQPSRTRRPTRPARTARPEPRRRTAARGGARRRRRAYAENHDDYDDYDDGYGAAPRGRRGRGGGYDDPQRGVRAARIALVVAGILVLLGAGANGAQLSSARRQYRAALESSDFKIRPELQRQIEQEFKTEQLGVVLGIVAALAMLGCGIGSMSAPFGCCIGGAIVSGLLTLFMLIGLAGTVAGGGGGPRAMVLVSGLIGLCILGTTLYFSIAGARAGQRLQAAGAVGGRGRGRRSRYSRR